MPGGRRASAEHRQGRGGLLCDGGPAAEAAGAISNFDPRALVFDVRCRAPPCPRDAAATLEKHLWSLPTASPLSWLVHAEILARRTVLVGAS